MSSFFPAWTRPKNNSDNTLCLQEKCDLINSSVQKANMIVWSLHDVVAYLERSVGFLALICSVGARLGQPRRCSEEAS